MTVPSVNTEFTHLTPPTMLMHSNHGQPSSNRYDVLDLTYSLSSPVQFGPCLALYSAFHDLRIVPLSAAEDIERWRNTDVSNRRSQVEERPGDEEPDMRPKKTWRTFQRLSWTFREVLSERFDGSERV